MPKKYCDDCGVTHTSLQCFKKPRKPLANKKLIARQSKKEAADREFKNQWLQDNPPDKNGNWYCYLHISNLCPRRLDIYTITIEHVIPKGRGKKYRYDPNNIKPSCVFCNSEKGSRTIESLAKDFPHLINLNSAEAVD